MQVLTTLGLCAMVKADVSCTTDDTDEENSAAQNALLPPQEPPAPVNAGLSAPVSHQKQDLLADFTLDGALKRPMQAGARWEQFYIVLAECFL